MEKLYRKIENGKRTKYEFIGHHNVPDLHEGIWLIQNGENSKCQTSLVWRIGDLKRPVDIVTLCGLLSFNAKLTSYLQALSDENSDLVNFSANSLNPSARRYT